jgi:two-component system LytT family response regulator
MSIKTLIVDDMPLAIANLTADLEEVDNIEVVGTAHGVMEAAKQIKKLKPDLLFLDIHMGDGDGFDLLEMISDEGLAVIFTTASKDHAIKAFQFKAIDYLLKPIDPQLLDQAIDKVVQARSAQTPQKSTKSGSIALNTQEEIRLVNIADIIRLEAMSNYTNFHLAGGSKILVTKTLKEFEKVLPESFLRVHQSHLVNRDQIDAYIKTEGGYLKMKDGADVPVSVRKKAQVVEMLK